jgi:hypothetical protein
MTAGLVIGIYLILFPKEAMKKMKLNRAQKRAVKHWLKGKNEPTNKNSGRRKD